VKHCILTQTLEMSDGKKTREQSIIPGSRSKVLKKMKDVIPMPGEFFFELSKKDCAKIQRGSVLIGYSLVEYPSLDAAKIMIVEKNADQ
jgi:hypothetical protein